MSHPNRQFHVNEHDTAYIETTPGHPSPLTFVAHTTKPEQGARAYLNDPATTPPDTRRARRALNILGQATPFVAAIVGAGGGIILGRYLNLDEVAPLALVAIVPCLTVWAVYFIIRARVMKTLRSATQQWAVNSRARGWHLYAMNLDPGRPLPRGAVESFIDKITPDVRARLTSFLEDGEDARFEEEISRLLLVTLRDETGQPWCLIDGLPGLPPGVAST